MPTLVHVQVPTRESSEPDISDASETILYDESIILLDGNEAGDGQGNAQSGRNERVPVVQRSESRNGGTVSGAEAIMRDQNETFDDSATILSKTLLGHDDSRYFEDEESRLDISKVRDVPKENHRNHFSSRHQDLYRTEYYSFVQNTMREFEKRYPGRLGDYRTMTLEEKEREQQNVLGLLSRLGIGKGAEQHPERTELQSQHEHSSLNKSRIPRKYSRDLDETMSPLLSPEYHRSDPICGNSFCMEDESSHPIASAESYQQKSPVMDRSQALHSQILERSEPPESPGFLLPDCDYDDCQMNMSTESVEIVRAEKSVCKSVSSYSTSFESPERLRPNPHKRPASLSAKRGTELTRHKYNDDALPPHSDSGKDSDPEIPLSLHMERLSMSPAPSSPNIFVASQSPISPRLTYGSSENEDSSCDEGKRRNSERRSSRMRKSDDTVDTFSYENKERRRAMREIPVNVRMKEGSTFHIDKLNVKHTEYHKHMTGKKVCGKPSRRLVEFPDPFVRYNRRKRDILNDIFRWIKESEREGRGQGRSVLLSLSNEQIVDINLKLLLNDESHKRVNSTKDPISGQRGKTIVVVRTKKDAEKWESALREGTGCSVLNHAILPLSERMRKSTADKAVLHDVVLTTFDALKSPDVAIPVDEFGHASFTKAQNDEGWYSSTSASKIEQKCKQLSVLHRINFERVAFVDELGRKSFIAKEGTARASAAVALRADSRYVRTKVNVCGKLDLSIESFLIIFYIWCFLLHRMVCFSKSESDGVSAMIALRNSHRGAIRSLSALLHLDYCDIDNDEQENIEDLLEDHILDLKELC